MRAVLALLAALLARWPAALSQQPATLSSHLSGTLPPETFAVRPAPFLVASRGHLVSTSDELGRAPAATECECLTRCFLNDQCFSFSYEPASSDCRLGRRRGHRSSTKPGGGLFRVRPGLARLDDFCWSDDECSRVTPAARCQDAVCVAGDGSDGTAGTAGGTETTAETASAAGTGGTGTMDGSGGAGATDGAEGAGTAGEATGTATTEGPLAFEGSSSSQTTTFPTTSVSTTTSVSSTSAFTTTIPTTTASTTLSSTSSEQTVLSSPTSTETTSTSSSTSTTTTAPSTTSTTPEPTICSVHPHCQLSPSWSGCQTEPCRCPPGQRENGECRTSPAYTHIGCYSIQSGDWSTTSDTLTEKECRDNCRGQDMPYFSMSQGNLCSCYRQQPSTAEALGCLEVDSSPCAGDPSSSCGGASMMELHSSELLLLGCIDSCNSIANVDCGTCGVLLLKYPCCRCASDVPFLSFSEGCQNPWFTTLESDVSATAAPGSQNPQETWTHECSSLSMLVGLNFPPAAFCLFNCPPEEEQHVEPPTGLKCNLHTDGAAVSLVSDARDRWTAAPVSAAAEMSVCPANTVVTGLFDTSGRLETVELLLCAPLVDGMLVSDRCYNLPTEPNSGRGTPTAESEDRSQCQLVAEEAWAVVGLAIDTDGTSTWVGALRCCRIDAA